MDLAAEYLQRRPANFLPMTPIQFLRRAVDVFPEKTAVIHGDIKYTWREHDRRCRLLASALRRSSAKKGDIVAILSPNTPPMLEAHFGVPPRLQAANQVTISSVRLAHRWKSFPL